jgi:hypothetical protein
MNIKHEQFIGIYENALSLDFCNDAINYFKTMQDNGFIENRQMFEKAPKISKDDETLFLHDEQILPLTNSTAINLHINNVLGEYYEQYREEFSVIKDFPTHGSYAARMQKTKIGGGYHVWHCESANRQLCGRIAAWMFYLNDVEEGGETEFLYQHKRIKPKAGTLLIFPAGFTHTHRGNPPLSNEKYIVTGWLEF